MRAVLLIAANFFREQRWLTILLTVYAIGGAALFVVGQQRVSTEDAVFFLSQQAIYAVLFSLFLSASAVQNERKTRRILAVLSKAVSRRQYLAGLLAGVSTVFLWYCLVIGVAGTWLLRFSGWKPGALWVQLGCTALASLLTAALTLFYTTFLSPLFATGATVLTLGFPAAFDRVVGHGWGNVLPVYSLVMGISGASGVGPSTITWKAPVIAAAEIVFFWIAATLIFDRRDVTVALE
jgi:ABC-type transport system involved in multi-copper enzyme maturation permease subunit